MADWRAFPVGLQGLGLRVWIWELWVWEDFAAMWKLSGNYHLVCVRVLLDSKLWDTE